MKSKRKMKFGVEIEFFGVTKNKVVEALNRAGIECHDEGYTHRVLNYWKVVYDGSVNGEGTGDGHGNELVSPVLYGEEGLKELELVLKVLSELGAKVDRTCGVHIHHDIQDLNLEQIKNIYRLYFKFQPTIDMLFPPSRRAVNNPYYCKPITEVMIGRINAARSMEELRIQLNDRYHTVNFCSFWRYGTIEFRQHAGSVDFEKIGNWVKITHRIIEKAMVGWKVEYTKDGKWRTTDSNWWFRQMVGKDVEGWVVNRLNYWKQRERERIGA